MWKLNEVNGNVELKVPTIGRGRRDPPWPRILATLKLPGTERADVRTYVGR